MKIGVLIQNLLAAIQEVAAISIETPSSLSSEEPTQKAHKTEIKSTPRIMTREKPSIPKKNESSIALWKSIHTKVSDLHQNWESALKQSRKHAFASIDAHRDCSLMYGKRVEGVITGSPFDGINKIYSHVIFGVRPSLAVATPGSEDTCSLGLDLSRIHQVFSTILCVLRYSHVVCFDSY